MRLFHFTCDPSGRCAFDFSQTRISLGYCVLIVFKISLESFDFVDKSQNVHAIINFFLCEATDALYCSFERFPYILALLTDVFESFIEIN